MYGTGHIIQEDSPDKVAAALLEFCGRVTKPLNIGEKSSDTLAEKLAKARAMIPKVE